MECVGLTEHSPTKCADLVEHSPAECTFLIVVIDLADLVIPRLQIIVRVPNCGSRIWWAIHISPRVASFIDPLPVKAHGRGSPEPAAWLGPELNSATSSSQFRAQLGRGLLCRPRALLGSRVTLVRGAHGCHVAT